MKIKFVFMVLLTLFLFGCSKENPLIGEWQSKPRTLMGISMPIEHISFLDDSMRSSCIDNWLTKPN